MRVSEVRGVSILCLTVVCGLVMESLAVADQAVLTPARDNTIYEQSAAVSNGAGDFLFAGRTSGVGGNSARRALLQFDIAGSIPAGSLVTSVTLGMTVEQTIAGSQTTTLHTVTSDWGEGTSNAPGSEGQGTAATTGDATWGNTFFNTDFWTAAGGDFNAVASGSASSDGVGSTTTWASTPEMVADVQGWLDDGANNFGWIVIGNETIDTTAKRYASRENAIVSARPTLTVEFVAPGDVPTISEWGIVLLSMLLLTSGTVVFGRRRMRSVA